MNTHKTNWSLILLLWIAGMLAAAQFAKISVTFTQLQTHYSSTASGISLVLSLTGLAGLFLAASSGLLIQNWGYKTTLIGALLLGAALSFTESFLPDLPILYALRVIEGLPHLAIVVTAPTLMSAASSQHQRSMVMSLWGTFFGVTFALANFFAPYHAPSLFVVHGVIMLLLAGALWFKLEPNLIKTTPAPLSLRSIIERHKHIYGQFNTVLPSLVFVCYTSMYVALLTFLPQMGTTAAWVMVALPLISIGGAFCAGALVQYFLSPPQMVKAAFAFILLVLLAFAVAYQQDWDLDLFKIALFFGLGIQQGAIYGMIPYLAKDSHQQAQSIAAIAQLGNLGSTIGPPLFAAAWGAFAGAGLLGLGGLITAAGLWLMLVAFKKPMLSKKP